MDVDALAFMGKAGGHSLPELQGKSKEDLIKLLERASESGLLTHLVSTYYTIHSALPWFLRQLFLRYYDGKDGLTSAQLALRAWVRAASELGDYYHDQFSKRSNDVIQVLAVEEVNLSHALYSLSVIPASS